jgi:hypothetical protein
LNVKILVSVVLPAAAAATILSLFKVSCARVCELWN